MRQSPVSPLQHRGGVAHEQGCVARGHGVQLALVSVAQLRPRVGGVGSVDMLGCVGWVSLPTQENVLFIFIQDGNIYPSLEGHYSLSDKIFRLENVECTGKGEYCGNIARIVHI